MEECLDLTMKDYWAILYYKEGFPGSEFEIVPGKNIVHKKWTTIQRGVTVTTLIGHLKAQARVVHISDDKEYLENNFESITESYIQDMSKLVYQQGYCDNYYKLAVKQKPPKTIKIKIADAGTQTDDPEPDENVAALEKAHEKLKDEHAALQEAYEKLRGTLKNALDTVDFQAPGPSGAAVKRKVLTPVRRENRILNEDSSSGEENNVEDAENDEHLVYIGSNKTPVPKCVYNSINWNNCSAATRKLLVTIFPRDILATHSLTGKPSPAFVHTDKIVKQGLDVAKVSDIVEVVSRNCKVSASVVRTAITTKCADENKMMRKKSPTQRGDNKMIYKKLPVKQDENKRPSEPPKKRYKLSPRT